MADAHKLLELAYTNTKQLKNILSLYSDFRSLAEKGNVDALAVYLDIEYMLGESGIIQSSKRREIFKLYFVLGYTQVEIADVLNITQKAVSYNLTEGLKEITAYYKFK